MTNPLQIIGRVTLGLFAEIGRLSVFAGRVATAAVTPRWYMGEIMRQMVRIGFYSLPVVGLSAVFIGAALALNIYEGGSRYGAEQFVPNIVVLGISRELGAVITGLMLAGRVSAGIAAEIGAMRVTEQIDALETLSAKKRVVFVYHELCGMGPEEIAQAVGVSYNTVRSRLHSARQDFTKAMKTLVVESEVRP